MSKRVHKQAGINAKLPLALRTGKYLVGFKKTLKSVINKQAKCVVVAANLPKLMRAKLEYYCVLANKIPMKFYEGTNNDLAILSGLKFRASVISILDQGEADLIENKDG